MPKPQGRLTDVLNAPADEAGQPQAVLMLDQLKHVPQAGDVLWLDGRNFPIVRVERRRSRHWLTGWKLAGLGVVLNIHADRLRFLLRRSDLRRVTWTPKDELPLHYQTNDLPKFTRLNHGWNADPNVTCLWVEQNAQTLSAHMRPNPYVYHKYESIPEITVSFEGCQRYRVTPVNDHGWYGGQCRFSGLAPAWGEFYEISGDTQDDLDPTAWTPFEGAGTRHFHFYLRDETLEVKAQDWSMTPAI